MIIFTKQFWDAFLSKLLSFFVSIKVLSISLITLLSVLAVDHFTFLLAKGCLTSVDYSTIVTGLFSSVATVFGVVLGVRAALQVTEIYKEIKGINNE